MTACIGLVATHEYSPSSNTVAFLIINIPLPPSEVIVYLESAVRGLKFLNHVTVGVGEPSAAQTSDGVEP